MPVDRTETSSRPLPARTVTVSPVSLYVQRAPSAVVVTGPGVPGAVAAGADSSRVAPAAVRAVTRRVVVSTVAVPPRTGTSTRWPWTRADCAARGAAAPAEEAARVTHGKVAASATAAARAVRREVMKGMRS
ncbi:hypothetical protein AB0K09_10320 [Streptomyces sp. NPDC049577]|uniref:hypothetical protein n=1 Tax=Streptomyces sp. NPDC049577 TaxID=3155153 RepID=UPI003445133E